MNSADTLTQALSTLFWAVTLQFVALYFNLPMVYLLS